MKIEIDLDLGQVVTQAVEKIESLEKALTLTTTSREFNRKRVIELEDELERYRRAHVCTSRCAENAHVAFEGNSLVKELEREKADETERADRAEKSLAESRELVAFKTRVADDMDKDKETLFRKLETERALVQDERTRANNLARRVAELERSLALSIDRENVQEGLAAESRRTAIQSIAARDRLLAAATTRVRAATEILSRPMVVGARNEIVTSKGAVLADAIGNALDALSA
jgi:hypothetical protein